MGPAYPAREGAFVEGTPGPIKDWRGQGFALPIMRFDA